jgi:hypothetical protein
VSVSAAFYLWNGGKSSTDRLTNRAWGRAEIENMSRVALRPGFSFSGHGA